MSPENSRVRVRIAPSPTGKLHLGTVRTALFNFLFARHHNGDFLIRIEDTDKERSKKEYEHNIIDNLKWLGIESDDHIIHQSERGDIYKRYLEKLLNQNKAYYCYCTKEELEAEKEALITAGLPPKYNGRCASQKPQEAGDASSQLIRLRVPQKKIVVKDMIRGNVTFDSSLIGDIPIAKNLDTPLFHFAVVVDDFEMKISHVIRGEDHLTNTAKHILIGESLEFNIPHYAHLPLLLAPQGGKLSKRDLETSFDDFRNQGYLKEALINFIALLGWHPEKDREVMSLDELIEEFDIKRVQKGGAAINIEKLDWLNAHYIRNKSVDELVLCLKGFIPQEWFDKNGLLRGALELQKDRLKKLSLAKENLGFFFELEEYEPELLIWKDNSEKETLDSLKKILDLVEDSFEKSFEKIVELAEKEGRGDIYWPLRVALSGLKNSPPPIEIMKVLGEEESIIRTRKAIKKLQ